MDNFEYYILFSVNTPQKPSIVLTGKPKRTEILVQHPVKINKVELKFEGTYKTPDIMDFHHDGIHDAISDKLFNVLNPLQIDGIQLIPATILEPKGGTVYDNYYYLHIYNRIQCLDKNKSVYMGDEDMGIILAIDKIVLDQEALSKIPLEQRLIFRMKEVHTRQLFHKSIVDKILSVNPVGLRFVKVEDYNPGSAFD